MQGRGGDNTYIDPNGAQVYGANTTPTSGWLSQERTFDSEGYYNVPTINSWGQNPYSYDRAFTQAQQGMQSANANIGNLSNQMMGVAGMDGGYPAMSNSFGLGSQTPAPIPGAQSGPDYMTRSISPGQPDSSSRGFNPWSMQGEALSRG